MKKHWNKIAEGLVVILIGVFFLVLSLGIKSNPVTVDGPLNWFIQARFLPLMSAIGIILLGIVYSVQLASGKANVQTSTDPKMIGREVILTAMTVAYLLVASMVGFLIPTIIYFGGMLFYLNAGEMKWWVLLILTAVYTIVTIYLTPLILHLNLI